MLAWCFIHCTKMKAVSGQKSCFRKMTQVVFFFADFAMVARLGEVKNARKADLRQALRCKLNSMKFQCSKPEYFQGKNFDMYLGKNNCCFYDH